MGYFVEPRSCPANGTKKKGVAIASGEFFGGWAMTITGPRLCTAVLDRTTFNATIIESGTDTYRLASIRRRAEEPVTVN